MRLQAANLSISMPGYFGRQNWLMPISQIAVCDLDSDTQVIERAVTVDAVFAHGLSIPYLFTTAPVSRPNLLFLFREPQRVPPLRALPALAPNVDLGFGFWSSRSSTGAFVDGLLLRAVSSAVATASLGEVGAEIIMDPDVWLTHHREVVTNPLVREHRLRNIRKATQLTRASNWLVLLLLGGAAVIRTTSGDWPDWAIGPAIAGFVAYVALRWAARRID